MTVKDMRGSSNATSLGDSRSGKLAHQPCRSTTDQPISSQPKSIVVKIASHDLNSANDSKSPVRNGEPSRQTHYKEDWEDKREVITKLYAGMSLEKLMDEMRQQYGFHAKRYMYLRRIRDWGIQKNVKAAEKEAAINEFENPEVLNRPSRAAAIPAHKIQRHLRQQRKDGSVRTYCQNYAVDDTATNRCRLAMKDSRAAKVALNTRIQQRYNSTHFMNGKFIFSPLERSSEIFLVALQEFIEVRIASFERDWSTLLSDGKHLSIASQQKSQHQMFQYLEAARMAHSFDDPKGFLYNMDKVCELTQDVLRTLHWTLVPDLLCGLHGIWSIDAKHGEMISRFFTDMAKAIFPDNHSRCLIQILDLFPDVRGRPLTFDAASRILLDCANRMPSSNALLKIIAQQFVPQFHLSWGLISYAQNSARQSLSQCLVNFGPASPEVQFAALQLSDALLFNGETDAARATTETALLSYLDNHLKPNVLCVKLALQMSYICCELRLPDDTGHYCSMGKSCLEELGLSESKAFEYTYFCEMIRLVHDLKLGKLKPRFSEASQQKCSRWSTCRSAHGDFSRLTRSISRDETPADDLIRWIRAIMKDETATVEQIVVRRTMSGYDLFKNLSPLAAQRYSPDLAPTTTTIIPPCPSPDNSTNSSES